MLKICFYLIIILFPALASELEERIVDGTNSVIIRTWNNTWEDPMNVGHVSLETLTHYVSLWPKIVEETVNVKGYVIKAPAYIVSSYEEDLNAEDQLKPDHTFIFKCFDVSEINKEIERIRMEYYEKEKLVWTINGRGEIIEDKWFHNCASLVRHLLIVGHINESITQALSQPIPSSLKVGYITRSLIQSSLSAAGAADNATLNSLMFLTQRRYLKPSVREYGLHLRYFAEELEFYAPSQIKAVLAYFSVLDLMCTSTDFATTMDFFTEQSRRNNRDYIAKTIHENNQIKFIPKWGLKHQNRINSNREFDKSWWSYLSFPSWARWASDGLLDEFDEDKYEQQYGMFITKKT